MVRFLSVLVLAAAGMAGLVGIDAVQAQAQPKKGDPPPVSISFRNDTKITIVVRGSTLVKGMIRRGQPILIRDGKTGFDNNVPPGQRLITVIDYNQNKPLLVDLPIVVPQGRDLQLVIRVSPTDPNRVILVQDQ
jgi:hypothetical protein